MSGFQTDTLTMHANSPAVPAVDLLPDSLTVSGADSLSVSAADTLHGVAAQIWDAAAVYGEGSSAIAHGLADAVPLQDSSGGNIWFHAMSLAVLAGYCYMVYHYREQVLMCLRSLIDFKPDDKPGERGRLYNSFIAFAVALSTFSAGMALTKIIPEWVDIILNPALISLGGIILWALTSVIIVFQVGIIKAAGKLTLSKGFANMLVDIKTTHLAAAAIFITPVVILYSGTNPVWDKIMLYIAGIELFIIGIGFLFRTFLLFVRQKVSILVWILYLCAVEIFPIALAAVLMVKHF